MRVRSIALLAALALVVGASSAWAQSQTARFSARSPTRRARCCPASRSLLPARPAPAEVGHHQRNRLIPVPPAQRRHLYGEVRAPGIQDHRQGRHPGHRRLQRERQHAAGRLDGAGDRDGHGREPDRRHEEARARSRPSRPRCCRAFPRRATRGSSSSRPPASPWTARTSAATCRASSPTTCRAARNPTNNKWSLDGVDITDMSATGASPSYYDFDAFQEMTINTGGVDVTQQTGGVGINLVTKSGTDRFQRLVALLRHRRQVRVATTSPTRCARRARPPATRSRTSRTTASRPAARSRRAAPGCGAATASRTINVGVISFYQPTPACQAFKADVGRARALDQRRQRLPEHRPHAARNDQPEG